MFIVYKLADTTNQYLFIVPTTRGGRAYFTLSDNTIQGGAFFVSTTVSSPTSTTVANQVQFFEGRLASGSTILSVGGSAGSSATTTYTGSSSCVIGASTTNPNNSSGTPPSGVLSGYISEVLIYNSVLSSSDRLLVVNYLKTKWNIP
jgi:hypothetical protein